MSQITNVNKIQFGILSSVDIEKMSVCEINKPTLAVEEGSVYDPRLGCVDSDSLCETCNENIWKCTGHFGHIKLQIPIILFFKQAVNMLKIFCHKCSRLLCTKEELYLQNVHGYEKTIEYLANKISFCGRCNSAHPEIRFDITEIKIMAHHKLKTKTTRKLLPVEIKQIFDNILDEDVAILGVDPKMFHPRNLVLENFPVIPICCRPRMITPDNVSDDDLSISLVEIIKNNNILGNNNLGKVNLCQEKYEKICAEIKFRTLTYCDNSKGKAIHNTNHKPMTGIKERITKKTGHVRQNLMGKRGDKTGRTVVGPDTTLKLNEVAIPEEIANVLTMPEYVTPFNIELLSKLVNTPGKASVVIKKNGMRISIATATVKRGTLLNHGDVIERKELENGVEKIKKYVVTNCKMELKKEDVVKRPLNNGDERQPEGCQNFKILPVILPENKILKLEIGDKVERYLKDGDYILLNRQPTLHRNSMQGMKVLIKPGRTIRLNLSIVTGFNMDFDGPSWTSN